MSEAQPILESLLLWIMFVRQPERVISRTVFSVPRVLMGHPPTSASLAQARNIGLLRESWYMSYVRGVLTAVERPFTVLLYVAASVDPLRLR